MRARTDQNVIVQCLYVENQNHFLLLIEKFFS